MASYHFGLRDDADVFSATLPGKCISLNVFSATLPVNRISRNAFVLTHLVQVHSCSVRSKVVHVSFTFFAFGHVRARAEVACSGGGVGAPWAGPAACGRGGGGGWRRGELEAVAAEWRSGGVARWRGDQARGGGVRGSGDVVDGGSGRVDRSRSSAGRGDRSEREIEIEIKREREAAAALTQEMRRRRLRRRRRGPPSDGEKRRRCRRGVALGTVAAKERPIKIEKRLSVGGEDEGAPGIYIPPDL
uniref:Uncharacterized protein n=1 Tax=Oryza sativa subsp. japonica TaxID=39947 RepID=Q84YZ3_ORYSJ|nr:hypothetical protein [Oryza sativa Japonica Group]BAD31551.1 hypothetical protein [Oryza sativa Japonica Group]